MSLLAILNRLKSRRLVRPWALSAPIAVLLICLPLLRPLRQPDPHLISDDEQARLATIQAIVEQKSLAIDTTRFRFTHDKFTVGPHQYSNQPPMLAVLLSGPYWVMHRFGLTFAHDPEWVAYLLTLLGVTLPVALAAGFIYRLGRIFELRRSLRAATGLAVVIGSGLISYATVLNAHASAASLLLSAVACLFHVTLTKSTNWGILWLALSGLCASLAACIDPPALIFLLLLLPVIVALRWRLIGRLAGVGLYVLGASGPILVHAHLVRPLTGDMKPGLFHPELAYNTGEDDALAEFLPPETASRSIWKSPRRRVRASAAASLNSASLASGGASASAQGNSSEEYEDEPPSFWRSLWQAILRGMSVFFGAHGIFSHFPVIFVGIVGTTMVMHRHWPATTKVLAAGTLMGACVVIGFYAAIRPDARDAMFATRWFVVFLPLVLFWAGAWLRKPHHPAVWTLAAVMLAFSMTVSLLGATGPLPRAGFSGYTVAGVWHNLRHPPQPPPAPPVLADRRWEDGIGE